MLNRFPISRQQRIHLLFIDLSAAFDGLVRKWMFERLFVSVSVAPTMHSSISWKAYTSTSLYHHSTDTFPTTAGGSTGRIREPPSVELVLRLGDACLPPPSGSTKNIIFSAQVRYRHILQSQAMAKLPTKRRQLVPLEWLCRRYYPVLH